MNSVNGISMWLLAWLSLCTSGARAYDAAWPGCATRRATTTLTVVKPGLSDNRVTAIHFIKCNFSTISIESLRIYPNVKFINLNDITVTDADRTLAFFTDLELIIMRQTSLASLPSDFFSNNRRLHYIEIKNTEMTRAPADILRPLTNLIRIRLDHNRLRSIPEPMFQNRSALYSIDLSHNLIENIPLNAFLGCNSLKSLHLNDNKLMHLPGNFFPNLLATGVYLNQFHFYAKSWDCASLNRILIKVKELRIAYDRDRYNGRNPACVMVPSALFPRCTHS